MGLGQGQGRAALGIGQVHVGPGIHQRLHHLLVALAALTHHLLGVHPDDMIEDYLLTNSAVDLAGRAPAIARQLEAMTGRPAAHDAVVAFLGVEPAYLKTALAEAAARHGSVDGYLEQALGVDAALRDRIGERLAA